MVRPGYNINNHPFRPGQFNTNPSYTPYDQESDPFTSYERGNIPGEMSIAGWLDRAAQNDMVTEAQHQEKLRSLPMAMQGLWGGGAGSFVDSGASWTAFKQALHEGGDRVTSDPPRSQMRNISPRPSTMFEPGQSSAVDMSIMEHPAIKGLKGARK